MSFPPLGVLAIISAEGASYATPTASPEAELSTPTVSYTLPSRRHSRRGMVVVVMSNFRSNLFWVHDTLNRWLQFGRLAYRARRWERNDGGCHHCCSNQDDGFHDCTSFNASLTSASGSVPDVILPIFSRTFSTNASAIFCMAGSSGFD